MPEQAGERLDRTFASLTGLPRRRIRALAEGGALWLNGRTARVLSRMTHVGDVLDFIPGEDAPSPPCPPPAPLAVLFEDAWVVAVDKPAGMLTQPGRERPTGELAALERVVLQIASREGRRTPVLLFHRLDRITTGVLIFARNHDAARGLAAAWSEGRVRKTYLAVVRGEPRETSMAVDAPIGSDAFVPGRQSVTPRGRPARSELQVLATRGGFALLEVRPLTGRTHQVRVHLAHLGLPVAGDALYGGGGGVPRPFLHAWRLVVPHPVARRRLALEAPLPADMCSFLGGAGLTLPATRDVAARPPELAP
jgi:23S rRNA pseudouridine1911/1915/1917 synthase